MSWCRRLQLSIVTVRNVSILSSKYLARNPVGSFSFPIPGTISRFCDERNLGFSGSKLLSSRLLHFGGFSIPSFKPMGSKRQFEKKPRDVLIALLLLTSGIAADYLFHLETIPYTNRTHFVLQSIESEMVLGETLVKNFKQGLLKGKILASNHPETMRMRSIAQNVIDALRKEKFQDCLGFGSNDELNMETKRVKLFGKWVLTRYLERIRWEIFVVDDLKSITTMAMAGGKIFVCTGLLQHFETDDEIATFIGHEVGHLVARHMFEVKIRNIWKSVLRRLLSLFVSPYVVDNMALFKFPPYSTEIEAEANYIGLMVMASAGYDPSTAISTYEKLGSLLGDHKEPICNKTAKLDPEAHAMKKAMNVYRARMSGDRIEGLLG